MVPDRPITTRSHDRLRRSGFADAVARQVLSANPADSFVMAVTGPWGSGKTSVLNMVAETVRHEDDQVVVLNFNPWMFSGAEQLTARYFSEVAALLRSTGHKRLMKVANRMVDYGERLRPLSELASIIPGVGSAAKGAQGAVVTSARALRNLDALSSGSVSDQRDAIAQAIAAQPRRFLVVLDDIDRLRNDEVLEIVRMVRLVADFPRTTFLLAYDRERVERALGGTDQGQGREYLEKIVQESYELPESAGRTCYRSSSRRSTSRSTAWRRVRSTGTTG